MFYKTQVRFYVKQAGILQDKHEIRVLGDSFATMVKGMFGLDPKNTAMLFVLNTLRNLISDEDALRANEMRLLLHCQKIEVDFNAIDDLDRLGRAA